MSSIETEPQEAEIAELAVQALTDAHKRAVKAGHMLVFVKNGELIQTGPLGTTVLKKLPPRKRVSVRVKRAKP